MLPLKESQFIIVGPVIDEEQTWWNNELDWVTSFTEATTFPKEILTLPLPPEGIGYMELTMEGELIAFIHPLPWEGV